MVRNLAHQNLSMGTTTMTSLESVRETVETHVSSVFTHAFFHKDNGIVSAFASETDAWGFWNSIGNGRQDDYAWFCRDHRGNWVTGDRTYWM